MLVLTRKKGQSIKIGEDIIVTILDVKPEGLKIGIDAPKNISILRSELEEEIKAENLAATRLNKDIVKNLGQLFK